MATSLELAQKYLAAGLCPIPVRADGSKAAAVKWEKFKTELPQASELPSMFAGNVGIALVHGAVSEKSEVVDIDRPGVEQQLGEWMHSAGVGDLFDKLVCVETPTLGHHLYARCTEPPQGNHHLAKQADGKKAIIETRGEGGYTIAPGSPGACHPTGKTYRLIRGRFTDIPILTPDERAFFHGCCELFNEYVEPEERYFEPFVERKDGEGKRPGDDYNERGDIRAVLQKHGWHGSASGKHWRRPGKDKGFSATYGVAGPKCFYVFSTSTEFKKGGHTPFTTYAILEHGGDFQAAARALSQQGYGTKWDSPDNTPRPSDNPARWIAPEPETEEAEDAEPGPTAAPSQAPESVDLPPELTEEDAVSLLSPAEEVEDNTDAIAQETCEASASVEEDTPLLGHIQDIANMCKRLPVKVHANGVDFTPGASKKQIEQTFKFLARQESIMGNWFKQAIGDAMNALPGNYGERIEWVRKLYPGKYQVYRNYARAMKVWPKQLRKTNNFSFYRITSVVACPVKREALLDRWMRGDFKNTQELTAEVRIIKSAQDEAKERQEQANERAHQRRVRELLPSEEERQDAQLSAFTPDTGTDSPLNHAATLPRAETPQFLPPRDLREMAQTLRTSLSAPSPVSLLLAQILDDGDVLAKLGYTDDLAAVAATLHQMRVEAESKQPPVPAPSQAPESVVEVLPPPELPFSLPETAAPMECAGEHQPRSESPSIPEGYAQHYTEQKLELIQRIAKTLNIPVDQINYEESAQLNLLMQGNLQRAAWAEFAEAKQHGLQTPRELVQTLKRIVRRLINNPVSVKTVSASVSSSNPAAAVSVPDPPAELSPPDVFADADACMDEEPPEESDSPLLPFQPLLRALQQDTVPRQRVTLPDGSDVMNLRNYANEQLRIYQSATGTQRRKALQELKLCQQAACERHTEGIPA